MIQRVKRDLALMARGLAIAVPPLFILVLLVDVDPQTWFGLLVGAVFGLIAGIPVIRDEIQQAKRRERDGLRH
jgi:hypothetical protein